MKTKKREKLNSLEKEIEIECDINNYNLSEIDNLIESGKKWGKIIKFRKNWIFLEVNSI